MSLGWVLHWPVHMNCLMRCIYGCLLPFFGHQYLTFNECYILWVPGCPMGDTWWACPSEGTQLYFWRACRRDLLYWCANSITLFRVCIKANIKQNGGNVCSGICSLFSVGYRKDKESAVKFPPGLARLQAFDWFWLLEVFMVYENELNSWIAAPSNQLHHY